MSKIWLLLVVVVAVQLVHSYPTEEANPNEDEGFVDPENLRTIKSTWKTIKKTVKKYTKLAKKEIKSIAKDLNEELCSEDYYVITDYEEDVIPTKAEVDEYVDKIYDALEKMYKKAGEKVKDAEELAEKLAEDTRTTLCSYIGKLISKMG